MKYPKTIYKYRNFTSDTHKRVLTSNELFYSSPVDFNDPFDCRIPLALNLLNSDEKIHKYVDDMIIRNYESLVATGRDIKAVMDNYTTRLKNNLEEEQELANEIEFSSQNFRLGIISMSKKWNSILMWSHYGDFHKGICYGFNEEQMRESRIFGGGGLVTYTDDFPILDPLKEPNMETSFIQTHTKAKKWKYEKEYRFFTYFPERIEPKSAKRKVFFAEDHLKEVILGIDFPKEELETVRKMTASKGIRLFKAEKVPGKFKIRRKEIK